MILSPKQYSRLSGDAKQVLELLRTGRAISIADATTAGIRDFSAGINELVAVGVPLASGRVDCLFKGDPARLVSFRLRGE